MVPLFNLAQLCRAVVPLPTWQCGKRKAGCYASAAQEHSCVINTALVTDPKQHRAGCYEEN